MKIIDQTPLLDANGQLSLLNRVQGMLKYGFSWPANLEAQSTVIAQLNKAIEKGFTLFRNQRLGASEIVVPLILLGPAGIYVMDATPLKGQYRARGAEWGALVNEKFQPAGINLLTRTANLAKILKLYFDRQGLKLSAPIEPVLLAADPGMHIDSVRPIVRPVMSDAISHFAAGLLSGRPVYNTQEITEFVERIQNPRSTRPAEQPSTPQDELFELKDDAPFIGAEPSRMQTILNSPHSDALIETGQPSDIDFALEDEPSPTVLVSNPYAPGEKAPSPARPAKRKIIGMTVPQLLLLVIMAGAEFCIIGIAAWIFIFQKP
jgi:hypothetical protein